MLLSAHMPAKPCAAHICHCELVICFTRMASVSVLPLHTLALSGPMGCPGPSSGILLGPSVALWGLWALWVHEPIGRGGQWAVAGGRMTQGKTRFCSYKTMARLAS